MNNMTNRIFQASVDERFGTSVDGATYALISRDFEQRPEEYERLYLTPDETASIYRDLTTRYIFLLDGGENKGQLASVEIYGEDLYFAEGIPHPSRNIDKTLERFNDILNPLVKLEQIN